MPTDLSPVARHVALMRVLVSLIMLAAGLLILCAPNFAIVHTPDEDLKKAAIGWIGLVIGY
jgi:hypothetical protein